MTDRRHDAPSSRRLWLWKNFVDGKPEYWAFDNAYPCHLGGGDPLTLGEPCGYALYKESTPGRVDPPEAEIIAAIKRATARSEKGTSQPTASDTPRTDAELERYYDETTGQPFEYVEPDFARTLEREAAALREQYAEAQRDLVYRQQKIAELRRERDEAGKFAEKMVRESILAEREVCAQVCEGKATPGTTGRELGSRNAVSRMAHDCAAAIRARSGEGRNGG